VAELTIADVWQQEQTHLMPNPAPFDGYVEQMAGSQPPR
jgi:hypothetical protein